MSSNRHSISFYFLLLTGIPAWCFFIDFLFLSLYNRTRRNTMITITKKLDLPDTYPLDRIGPLSDLLFFDIETTGFSGDSSNLYLIGCTYFQDGCWNLIQWFADTAAAEPELLDSFFSFLKNYKILIHFNGDGFDIPYLLKRCRHLKKDYDFSAVTSIDIYKKIRPYRKLLGLESMKQKAIETFLGISRTDQYSGGQLIDVYRTYLKNHDNELYDLLILHNEDDLKGMPSILPILHYPNFFEGNMFLKSQQILTEVCNDGSKRHLLELICQSPCAVPVPFSCCLEPVSCFVSQNQLTLEVTLFEGELKNFYSNYQDYYYLPEEDQAVPKAEAVRYNQSACVKATAKNCYTREQGVFLPQFTPVWEPALKKERRDKCSYAALIDVCLQNPDSLSAYLKQLFCYLGVK